MKKSLKSIRAHHVTCPKNDDRKYKNGMIGKTPWNKGLSKETNEILKGASEKLSGVPRKGTVSIEGRMKLSSLAKERGLGGYRPHPNRGTYYKEIWFDSSWEVRVAKSLDENKIKWERPRNGFIWNDEGNKYYPDFYLIDHDVYLDPKNAYLQKIDKQKIEAASIRNNIKVIVLNEEQLEWSTIALMV